MFGPGGSFFVWGREGRMEGRTDSLPAGRLHGRSVFWGCEGLGIEAVLDRVWCFCVIFKFIFGVFWIIIMEKDGWPDWLPD